MKITGSILPDSIYPKNRLMKLKKYCTRGWNIILTVTSSVLYLASSMDNKKNRTKLLRFLKNAWPWIKIRQPRKFCKPKMHLQKYTFLKEISKQQKYMLLKC